MKKIVLFFVLFNITLGAKPKELVLNFHHTMDGQALTNALVGVNNLGNKFKYSRLQYYVDDIEIIYNQGDTFSYPGVLLIDALSEENTTVNLGSLDFNSISAVRFAVGVGPDLNNLDPSVLHKVMNQENVEVICELRDLSYDNYRNNSAGLLSRFYCYGAVESESLSVNSRGYLNGSVTISQVLQ